MTLSEKVREAAQDVMVATEAPLSNTLNRFVEAFIGWPFAIRPAIIEGLDGSRSAPFAAVVYMVPGGAAVPDIRPVPADRAAALIDACEALTVNSLRASYGRIAQAKQLRKTGTALRKELETAPFGWPRDAIDAALVALHRSQQRPFVWHIWDGRRDGFSALVNYHTLNRANLEKLTYAYLGDWIRRQQAAVLSGESGSEARLVAATQLQDELKRILEGGARGTAGQARRSAGC